jgi:hypothetical protein
MASTTNCACHIIVGSTRVPLKNVAAESRINASAGWVGKHAEDMMFYNEDSVTGYI